MIFAVIGILRQPGLPHDPAFETAYGEHLAQPAVRIVNAGVLRDPQGEPFAVMGLIDVPSLAEAQAYLDESPFAEGGYYDHVHLGVYDVEVGRVG